MTYRRPIVGIVGAGQLARMTAQAAIPLDIEVMLLAAHADDGAAQVTPKVLIGSPDDERALVELASRCDVMTFDHELVDPEMLARLEAAGHMVRPSSSSMAMAQDKRRQRQELGDLGLPIPAWTTIDSVAEVAAFGAVHGWPVVLKASRGGYDGRGVWILEDLDTARDVVAAALAAGTVLLAEAFLPLDLEIAILLARRPNGDMAIYPPIETVQREGICRELRVPAAIGETLGRYAMDVARRIAEHIEIVGIMAVEFLFPAANSSSTSWLHVHKLGPLDNRGRRYVPVRAASPRRAGLAVGVHRTHCRCRCHAQYPWSLMGITIRVRTSPGPGRIDRPCPPVWQSGTGRPQGRPCHGSGGIT
jgi:5-(carboxyamino)imidazole ribonucleotide synthase